MATSLKQRIVQCLRQSPLALNSEEVAASVEVTEAQARSSLGKLFKAGDVRCELKYEFNGKRKDERKYYFIGASK